MGSQSSTLEQLWQSLGLDSLPPDAGTAIDLDATRVPDWEQATVRHEQVSAPPITTTERIDLPRISLTPPVDDSEAKAEVHRDLVVTGLLGEGGMGRVLLAHQASLGRDVAVKVPRGNASQGTINALVSEAKTTGGLEHPGVIPVYSLASDAQGHPALVMKRVDGVSWSMLLRSSDDPAWDRLGSGGGDRVDAHVELLRQVCNAIAYAHRKGVLHRDIKPSNVLIGEFGEVYVADWGIAIRKVEPPRGAQAEPGGHARVPRARDGDRRRRADGRAHRRLPAGRHAVRGAQRRAALERARSAGGARGGVAVPAAPLAGLRSARAGGRSA